MDKEKQIKLEIFGVLQDCDKKYCDLYDCDECCAEKLYNAGYRKIDKDSVVLTKEEWEKELGKMFDKGFDCAKMFIEKEKQKASKETAEKIIKRLKQIIKKALKSNYKAIEKREEKHPYLLEDELFEVRCKGKIDALSGMDYELDELAKQFGVEIKE